MDLSAVICRNGENGLWETVLRYFKSSNTRIFMQKMVRKYRLNHAGSFGDSVFYVADQKYKLKGVLLSYNHTLAFTTPIP